MDVNETASNATSEPLQTGSDSSCGASTIFNMIVTAAVVVLGVPGNCLILRVYWTKARKTSTNVLIMALAWADLTVCLYLSVKMVGHALECGGCDVDLFVKVIKKFGGVGLASSLGITAVVAVDRYFCICKPQKRYCTPRRAKVSVFVVGLVAIIVAIPEFIRDFLYPPKLGITILVPIFQTVDVLTACATIGLCYGKVYAAISRHVKVGATLEHISGPDEAVATKIDEDRHKPQTKSSLPRKGQPGGTRHDHTTKKGSDSTSIYPKQTKFSLSRIEANSSTVDNEVSTVIILPKASCIKTLESTSRRNTLDMPQLENGKRVESARHDSKDGSRSISKVVSRHESRCDGDRGHHKEDKDTVSRHARRRVDGTVLQRKTTKMLFITSVVFLLTWLPDLISNATLIAYLTGSNIDPKGTLFNILDFLYCSIHINNAINPLIYGLANKRFRRDCKEVLSKFGR